jgi:hypothetical protein
VQFAEFEFKGVVAFLRNLLGFENGAKRNKSRVSFGVQRRLEFHDRVSQIVNVWIKGGSFLRKAERRASENIANMNDIIINDKMNDLS